MQRDVQLQWCHGIVWPSHDAIWTNTACLCDTRCHEGTWRSAREYKASTPLKPVSDPEHCALCLERASPPKDSKRRRLLIAMYETRAMRAGTYW